MSQKTQLLDDRFRSGTKIGDARCRRPRDTPETSFTLETSPYFDMHLLYPLLNKRYLSGWSWLYLEHRKQPLECPFLASLLPQADGERQGIQVSLKVGHAGVGITRVPALEGLVPSTVCGHVSLRTSSMWSSRRRCYVDYGGDNALKEDRPREYMVKLWKHTLSLVFPFLARIEGKSPFLHVGYGRSWAQGSKNLLHTRPQESNEPT